MPETRAILSDPFLLNFIRENGYAIRVKRLIGDWSARSYVRVFAENGKDTAMLMICRDDRTKAQMKEYVRIANALRQCGFSAPDILAEEREAGLMLVEDLGEFAMDSLVDKKHWLPDYYAEMGEIVRKLREDIPADFYETLPAYEDTAIGKGHVRIMDWYVPLVMGMPLEGSLKVEYNAIWKRLIKDAPAQGQCFTHMDFHPANLVYRLSEKDVKRKIGILDFQNACVGSVAYDTVNLLRDIRRKVPSALQKSVLASVQMGLDFEERESFMHWYKLLSVQYHSRVLGQVYKLAIETQRDDLLIHVPRIKKYLVKELDDPLFAELSSFFSSLGSLFSEETEVEIDASVILADAF
ncbi:MAG: phosphotransferase [Pseudobdellovibrionaceae bacterium]